VFVCFLNCTYLISNCCFSTLQTVINRIGWLVDRHDLLPNLYDTVPLFAYTDKLLFHCILIYSKVHCQLVSLLRDDSVLLLYIRWVIWNKSINQLFQLESLSGKCANVHTVASNNRDQMPWSLYYWLFGSRHIYLGVILCTHPVHGESHIQCNANREVATQQYQQTPNLLKT